LLPAEERTCTILSRTRGTLPHRVWLPLPPEATFETACDKLTALERARCAGIPIPETHRVTSDSQIPTDGRWILKPRRGTGAYGVRRIAPGEGPGSEVISRIEDRFGPMILQFFVPGRRNGYGVSLAYDPAGACRAGFVHRKVREFPASGGVSTCAESVHRPDLVALARRYVEGGDGASPILWEGLINFEFKVHPGTGTPFLIEVNPRLWGSLPLAIRAGVDFPGLLWRLSLGEKPKPVFDYRDGVRMRWALYGELAHAWERVRRGDFPWDVLGEESEADFLWDAADPGPFWASLASWSLTLVQPGNRDIFRR
jgi:predicted ATP-grasp superfamily ATP-dependent carboligase